MSGFKNINNANLHYNVAGKGDVICLIHGFSFDHRIWDDQVKELSKFYKVLSYDLRGFGESTEVVGTHFSHHEDLRLLLDELNIDKVAVIGMSMGCRVAFDFALEYPDRTNAIIISAPSLNDHIDSRRPQFNIVKTAFLAKRIGMKSAKKMWLKHPFFQSFSKNKELKAKMKNIVKDYSGKHWLVGSPHENYGPNSVEAIKNIKTSTLILVGEKEMEDRSHLAEIINKNIKGSELIRVPIGGHMVNMENPQKYNELVLSFLNKKHGN